jgi:starch synthase
MRIVQTVFGVFHHFELARQLHQRGHLQRIYSTWPWARVKREGLPRELVETFPWIHGPEMLIQRFGFHPVWLLDQTGYSNALAFDWWTSRRAADAETPDALIGISGSSLKTGQEVQARGGRFVCDRGSSHQRYQERIVAEEYRRWGVDRPVSDIRDTVREEKIYAVADAITVPSSFAARSFVEEGVPAEKVRVIPYGARLEQFVRTGEPAAGRFEVLFAGSVGLRKGVPYLLEAFAKVRHPAKRLRVAGALNPDLRTVLGRLPQEQVEMLGAVSQARLAELMSTSHVMVLPSIEEGLALVQGQALACGCPVLASTNTGGEDLFTDGVEGFIVPVRDVEALTDRMQRLADDPALQQRMSEAALRRVRSIGGWNEYGDRWEALLRELTGKD